NNGNKKQVSIRTGSGSVLLKPSAKTIGKTERRKLKPQMIQSAVGVSTDESRGIHHPIVRLCQSKPVNLPKNTSPRRTSTPAAIRGTYRSAL
ncbi:hypothetical protein, partial [[Eubacterium] cellulosolvens]